MIFTKSRGIPLCVASLLLAASSSTATAAKNNVTSAVESTYQANGRRQGSLGGASPGASKADCARSMDVKLYKDSPGSIRFKPNMKSCMTGKVYSGSTEDGNCHVILVPSVGNIKGNAADTAFAASVNCDDTGAVYQIGLDANGTMTVVERLQEDYGPELDPPNEMPTGERTLLEVQFDAAEAHATSGLRGKAANQLRDLSDRFLAENHGDHDHRDLQSKVVIDALVLWTPNAECRNAGLNRGCARTSMTSLAMTNLVNQAVAQTNVAFSNSGVNVQLNLVHTQSSTYTEASTNGFDAALVDITTQNDGKLDEAHALRALHGADIVALLIDDPGSCGLAYVGPRVDLMFSVTAWNCVGGYTFAHEIAHNFGCDHDRGSANACTNTGYNYGFRDPSGRFRDILAYNCITGQCDRNPASSCTRVQRFSNNYAGFNLYNGSPIGNAQNDNARRINDVALTVSNYFKSSVSPTPAPTTITIQAESYSNMFGVIRENTSDAGGGQNVGNIQTGDWMSYPAVMIPTTGTYRVSYRVAALYSGGSLQLEKAGGTPVYGMISIPATGGYQTWTTISHIVTLSAGSQNFGIKATGSGWNINWFTITKA